MTRKIGAVAGAAAVAVLAVFYLLVWGPSTKQLSAARANLAAAQNSGVQAAADHVRLLGKVKALRDSEQVATELQAAAPTDPALPDLIDQLDQVAAASGVTLTAENWSLPAAPAGSAAPSSTAPSSDAGTGGGVTPIPVTVAVQGSPASLLAFVHNLSAIPRLAKVSGFTLVTPAPPAPGAPAPQGGAGQPTTTVSLTVFEVPAALPAQPKVR